LLIIRIDYERGKFQDKINAGTLTLERTTAWISEAIARSGIHDVVANASVMVKVGFRF
jgi:T-complex protein 11